MTVEAKKEVLKYMILNDRYFRDTYSYKLLRCRYFDNVINNISEISLNYKNVIENDKIQANQFDSFTWKEVKLDYFESIKFNPLTGIFIL